MGRGMAHSREQIAGPSLSLVGPTVDCGAPRAESGHHGYRDAARDEGQPACAVGRAKGPSKPGFEQPGRCLGRRAEGKVGGHVGEALEQHLALPARGDVGGEQLLRVPGVDVVERMQDIRG